MELHQIPPNIANNYAESPLIDEPPEDQIAITPYDNTPDCDSCTDGCSACTSAGSNTGPTSTPTQTPGLRPVNGSSYYANAGDTYNIQLITSDIYSQVYWYVRPPNDGTTYGKEIEIDTGDGTSTVADFSYTLPTGTPGTYRITAYIYYSDYIGEETYDVYVY